MKRRMYPTLRDQMKVVASRFPVDMTEYIDKEAERQLRTRSDMIRILMVELLEIKGVIEPRNASARAAA